MNTLMQVNESPAIKLKVKGLSSLDDSELISIIIGGIKSEQTTKEQAARLLKSIKYDYRELRTLTTKQMQDAGLTHQQSIRIIASCELIRRSNGQTYTDQLKINGSQDIYNMYRHLIDLPHEEFHVIHLNRANRVIDKQMVSKGGLSGTIIDTRLILRHAIEKLATSIIAVHNHPSGNLKPSEADVRITDKLKKSAEIMDIQLLDHIIVSTDGFYSFTDEGLI